jgi:hypothetical protein
MPKAVSTYIFKPKKKDLEFILKMLQEVKVVIRRSIVDKVKENKIKFIPIDENELIFHKTKQR